MKIEISPFRFKYYYSLIKGVKPNEYIFHHLRAYNFITVDGVEMKCSYATGLSFYRDDLKRPRPRLELNGPDYTHRAILILDELEPWQFDLPPSLTFIWGVIEHNVPAINTLEKLKQLYDAIKANTPRVSDFLNPEIFTESISDYYETTREPGYYFPKGLYK